MEENNDKLKKIKHDLHQNQKENISDKDNIENVALDNTDGFLKQIINLINSEIDQLDILPQTKRSSKNNQTNSCFFNIFKKKKKRSHCHMVRKKLAASE